MWTPKKLAKAMATILLPRPLLLISLQIWSFVTHQRRIIISIYHSTNVREEFYAMHGYELNIISPVYMPIIIVYRAVYTRMYIDGLVDYIRMPILTKWSHLLLLHHVNYHPNENNTHSIHATINLVRERICRNQYHATINFDSMRIYYENRRKVYAHIPYTMDA
jgi:hypothetical protein